MLFGKPVNELQSDIVIGDSAISGTLHHVTDYTGFSSILEEQSGNYLALKIANENPEGVTTTVEVVNGTKGPVTLDDDMNIVLLIKDASTQSVRVISTNSETTEEKTYGLTGLTLEPSA